MTQDDRVFYPVHPVNPVKKKPEELLFSSQTLLSIKMSWKARKISPDRDFPFYQGKIDTMLRWTPPQRWSPSVSMLMNNAITHYEEWMSQDGYDGGKRKKTKTAGTVCLVPTV